MGVGEARPRRRLVEGAIPAAAGVSPCRSHARLGRRDRCGGSGPMRAVPGLARRPSGDLAPALLRARRSRTAAGRSRPARRAAGSDRQAAPGQAAPGSEPPHSRPGRTGPGRTGPGRTGSGARRLGGGAREPRRRACAIGRPRRPSRVARAPPLSARGPGRWPRAAPARPGSPRSRAAIARRERLPRSPPPTGTAPHGPARPRTAPHGPARPRTRASGRARRR